MKKIHQISSFIILIAVFCFNFSPIILAAQVPIVNAGPNQYADSGQKITLQGSGSDPNGGILTFFWTCDGGTLSAYNTAQPVYTAPNVVAFNPQAIYTCILTVKNSANLSSSDSVKIYVNYGATVPNIDVQTEAATNIYSNQATLNGTFNAVNNSAQYVWFQYGQGSNYGTETAHQSMTGTSGTLTQNISSLYLNADYHFRAVVQDTSGKTYYGQNMTFSTVNTNSSTISNAILSVQKKVMNLSSGNSIWSAVANAKPSETLCFVITLQAGNQDVHNVLVKDILPANLIYKGNLLINSVLDTNGNPISGINIGTITSHNIAIVSYQAQVAPSSNFVYGSTTLNNTATVTSTETGTQTSTASVIINNTTVAGATSLPTGLTNSLLTDSFFLPMLIIVFGAWFYFSGNIYKFSDWLGTKIG